MDSMADSATISTTSLVNGAELRNDILVEEIEPISSLAPETVMPREQENSAVNSCGPNYKATIASEDEEKQLNDGIRTTIQQVGNEIKQLADGVCEIAAVVKDIRDSVNTRAGEKLSSRRLRSPYGYPDDYRERRYPPKRYDDIDDLAYVAIPFPTPKMVIPEVSFCNREGFNERLSAASVGYCIEALRVSDHLKQSKKDEPLDADVDQVGHDLREYAPKKEDDWIHKVRIQSESVLNLLGRCYESIIGQKAWGTGSFLFERPFRCFIRSQDQMKRELKKLEAEVAARACETENGGVERQSDQATALLRKDAREIDSFDEAQSEGRSRVSPIAGREGEENVVDDSSKPSESQKLQQELEEVRCYVDFVDTHITPLSSRFDPSDPSKPQKIRYQDLWYLFKLGDLVYQPQLKSGSAIPVLGQSRTSATRQAIWRVYRMQISWDKRESQDPVWRPQDDDETTIWCYYIDFDGASYGAVARKLAIKPYEGERDIMKLPCYPLTYLKDASEVLKSAREDGTRLVALIEDKENHAVHAGWTLTDDPEGYPVESDNVRGEKIKLSPEHVESDVMIDFNEAFNFHPSWMPKLTDETRSLATTGILSENESYYYKYANEDRSKLVATYHDSYVRDIISDIEFNHFLANDPYLVERDAKLSVAGDELALLPKRLFGYALWERKFVLLNVRNVEEKRDDGEDNPFDKLQIDGGHKKMIQAIISSYFANKKLEDEIRNMMTQDLIRGKGKGIVILLHGLPGVGKTATAEAVAQKWRKPLFPITCGDLGDTAATVEKTLNDIFRFAHLWECVLLLDEADVFITQRSKSDLKRNALVSGGMLEYYNGILFLTTNRPGVLDQAVKSRVHLSLRYEALTLEQTKAIFRLNIERLKNIESQRNNANIERNGRPGRQEGSGRELAIDDDAIMQFAEKQYKRNTNKIGRWNGRQIRNAFSIAASLADFNAKTKPGLPRFLSAEQFREVQKATVSYDKYRASVLGKTDGELAHINEERYDDDADDDRNPPQSDSDD